MPDNDTSEVTLAALTEEFLSRLRRLVHDPDREAELKEMEVELSSIVSVARALGTSHA